MLAKGLCSFLATGHVFHQGPTDATGWRFSDNLDTYGFTSGLPGHRIYVSRESESVTYSALNLVGADGTLSDLRPFGQRGGESIGSIEMAMCMLQTDKSSSTTRRPSKSPESMCQSARSI